MLSPIYTIIPHSAHRFIIRLHIASTLPEIQCYLPIWIPGSYTRRDFSRFLSISKIENNGKPVHWQLTSPSSWSAQGEAGTWLIEYEVYARDYSVRGCYLDDERAIFNPACACLAVRGAEKHTHTLIWQADATRQTWQIAGAIPNQENQWQFKDYQHLIDTPLMMAEKMRRISFSAGNIEHEIAICGEGNTPYDLPRLTQDVQAICQSAIDQFGALPDSVKHYSFLLFLTQNGYGGLEHQHSTLLIASRSALPIKKSNSAYTQLLGLFAHEYFHTWNVKSLRPTEYAQGYDIEREQPSEMLWLFEGFTAYFDNLLLLHSARISSAEYLKLLSNDISRHLQRLGHQRQSLAHSSLEAWTKLYNGGENAGNISTNYYIHGALAAWCIDVYLRVHAHSPYGLDIALREIWQDPQNRSQGLDETRFIEHIQKRLPAEQQTDFAKFLHRLLHHCDYLPLTWAAQEMGLTLTLLPPQSAQDLGSAANEDNRATSEAGIRWQEQQGQFFVRLTQPDSAASASGIAANDEIISICGEKPSAERLWQALMLGQNGQLVHISVLRDGLIRHYQWPLSKALNNTAWLSPNADNTTQQRRHEWLKHSL